MRFALRRGSSSLDVAACLALALGSAVAGIGGYGRVRDYREVGLGPTGACALARTSANRCIGLAPEPFANTPAIRSWLMSLDAQGWGPAVTQQRRVKGTADRYKTVTFEPIRDSERMPLVNLSDKGLVVARLTADPNDEEEPVYGIGGDKTKNKGLRQQFYVVLDAFDSPSLPTKVWGRRQVSIATWTLYGVTTDGNNLMAVNTGRLKWCRHGHAGSPRRSVARFIACDRATRVQALERRLRLAPSLQREENRALREALDTTSLLSLGSQILTRRTSSAITSDRQGALKVLDAQMSTLLSPQDFEDIRLMTVDEAIAPGWITCGIGCCSIDS